MKFFIFIFALGLSSCASVKEIAKPVSAEFKSYWYRGEAEISSYDLEQSRYGEMRKGKAVLIFVTEPFSRSKQVKLDEPDQAGGDHAEVLKLNMEKTFLTGIYPYSMMLSVFSPTGGQSAIKVTMSAQEWCGHVFAQLNRSDAGYRLRQFSYFEKDGDTDRSLGRALLEDEIWTKLRISPESLPQGEITVIPGLFASRLLHFPLSASPANASLKDDGEGLKIYTLSYQKPERKLAIRFEAAFPYRILSWEETYRDGFGDKARVMTTRATLKKNLMSDYWKKNSNADLPLRQKLGL